MNSLRIDAVRLRDLDEIRVIAQVGLSVIALIKKLLPLPYHAQILVVDDHHLDRQIQSSHGGEFLNIHLEAAVARNTKHGRLGLRELNANRGWQGESHRTQTAGSDESSWRIRAISLRRPHLVLADIGKDDAMVWQPSEKFVEEADGRLRQSARIKFCA